MTFTLASPFDDIARVRFAIGDTEASAPIFSDELITDLISEAGGSWRGAARLAIRHIITQLLIPGFTADWLKVEPDKAVPGWERLLKRLEDEEASAAGESSISVKTGLPSRIDGDCPPREGEYS